MLEAKTIFQGDSVGWLVWHDPNGTGPTSLATGYTCRIAVGGTAIDRAVTVFGEAYTGADANTAFVAGLTLAETAALTSGQYVVSIKITNTTIGFSGEQHGILTVAAAAPNLELPTRLDRLKQHREALLDAKDEAVGGSVQEVWNGRYGNKMKYQTMTYAQISDALAIVDKEIAAEISVAGGGSRRAHTQVVWAQ